MNFTELQMELRSIEEHISQLHNEIEKMKPQTEEKKKANFEAISRLARKYPVMNAKLIKAATDVKKVFISGLSYLLLTEETGIYERLLYLTRLSIGCDLDMTAEEIYKKGLEFEAEDIEGLCKSLTDYKYTYLVESFIIANLSEEASVNMLSVIADIAKGMECDKEEIRVIAQVAKAKLIDNMDILKDLPMPSKNRWSNQFTEYIPYDWIVKQRIMCGKIYTLAFESIGNLNDERMLKMLENEALAEKVEGILVNGNFVGCHPCKIINLQLGSLVKKGDSICVYKEKIKRTFKSTRMVLHYIFNAEDDSQFEKEEKILIAPCEGVVFFVEDKEDSKVKDKKDEFIAVYVVSYFDEYEDFCKWYRNGCK